jgi:hypothetical protein
VTGFRFLSLSIVLLNITPAPIASIIVVGLLWCALFYTAIHLLARYVVWYRLTKQRLTIVFAGIPIYWTDLEAISDVYRIRWIDLFHPLLLFGARQSATSIGSGG